MNKESIQSGIVPRDEHLPPLIERNLDERSAQTRDRRELGFRRVIGYNYRARNSKSPRMPCDALRHVASAGGVHAFCEFIRIGRRDGVSSPSQLERSDWLKVLELQIDLGAVDIQAHERSANY